MNGLRVTLSAQPPVFRPGDVVTGTAEWALEEAVDELELQLCWTTEGATGGDAPPVVVLRERFRVEGREGKRNFRFELPAGPWSFEGRLFSVRWYVSLAKDEFMDRRADFALGPDGAPIVVRQDPPP